MAGRRTSGGVGGPLLAAGLLAVGGGGLWYASTRVVVEGATKATEQLSAIAQEQARERRLAAREDQGMTFGISVESAAVDEPGAFEKYLRLEEGATVRLKEKRTGIVAWKVFDRGPGRDEDHTTYRGGSGGRVDDGARMLMFPDSGAVRLLRTTTSPFDEVWTGESDTGHAVEAYWSGARFVVWFKTGTHEYTQDGNRLVTGDRRWFRTAVVR